VGAGVGADEFDHPHPCIKETGFPRTCTHTQLNRLFRVKYGAWRPALSEGGLKCHAYQESLLLPHNVET